MKHRINIYRKALKLIFLQMHTMSFHIADRRTWHAIRNQSLLHDWWSVHNRRPHFLREQRKFVPNVMKLSIVIDHLYRFTLFIKISNSDHSTMRVLLPTFRFVSCLMGLGERHKSFYRCSLFANLFFFARFASQVPVDGGMSVINNRTGRC